MRTARQASLSQTLRANGGLSGTLDSKVKPSSRVSANLTPPLGKDVAYWGSDTPHIPRLPERPQDFAWLTAEGEMLRHRPTGSGVVPCSPCEPLAEGVHLPWLLCGKVARDLGGWGPHRQGWGGDLSGLDLLLFKSGRNREPYGPGCQQRLSLGTLIRPIYSETCVCARVRVRTQSPLGQEPPANTEFYTFSSAQHMFIEYLLGISLSARSHGHKERPMSAFQEITSTQEGRLSTMF